jgi:hypothetical protein
VSLRRAQSFYFILWVNRFLLHWSKSEIFFATR